MTNNKIKVTGPEEILKLLTKKLKENGFKENFNLFPAIISALYIDESSFCLKETATNYNVSNTTKTYKALQNWHYLSNLKPEELESEFSEKDWVWVKHSNLSNRKSLVKWTENDLTYGLGFLDFWTSNFNIKNYKNDSEYAFKKAIKKEVKERLKQEARKRGFVEGAVINNSHLNYSSDDKKIENESYDLNFYSPKYTVLFINGIAIMKNGKWAEVVEKAEEKDKEPKFTVSSSGNITTDKFKYQYPLTPNEVFKPTLKIDLNKYNVTIKKEGDNLIVDKELKSFDWEELYKKLAEAYSRELEKKIWFGKHI